MSCAVEIPAASPEAAVAALQRHLPNGWGLASSVVVGDSAGNSVEVVVEEGKDGRHATRSEDAGQSKDC
ncbi:hypothetical protein V6O07_05075 [Arthrospira platensis SPKY2]